LNLSAQEGRSAVTCDGFKTKHEVPNRARSPGVPEPLVRMHQYWDAKDVWESQLQEI